MIHTPLPCKLGDAECDKLDKVLAGMPAAEEYCALCEKAGLDMTGYKNVLQAQKSMATGIKATFFPHRI